MRVCISDVSYVTIHGTPSAIRAYSDPEGARVKGTAANRLNFAFLGQRIALIGHKRLEVFEPDASGNKYSSLNEIMGRQPINAIRCPCPLCAKSGHIRAAGRKSRQAVRQRDLRF